MGEIERLTAEQLEYLERLLAEQGAPVLQRFQPPASSEALTAVESYLKLPLPDELRQWWGWHDATDVNDDELAVQCLIGPSFIPLRTDQAVEASRELRIEVEAEDTAPLNPDSLWSKTWLAIGSGGRVACECKIQLDAPVPVLDVDYHKAAYPGAVVAHSLGEMVRWWIEALESGAWRYDVERNRWDRVYERVPPERDRTGLV